MRTLEDTLIDDKKRVQNVDHYISPHSTTQEIAVSTGDLHTNNFTSQTLCRQVNVSQLCPEDAWGTELLGGGGGTATSTSEGGGSMGMEQLTEEDRSLAAALVAVQFVQQHGRHPLMHELGHIAKVVSEATGVDNSNTLLNNPIRLYQQHSVEEQVELRNTDLVDVPHLLPPLPQLKRPQDPVWYHMKPEPPYQEKDYKNIDESVEVNCTPSQVHNKQQQNRKSLPHKKRISRKLKRNLPQHIQQSSEETHTVDIIKENVNNEVLTVSEHNSMPSSQLVNNTVHTERVVFICQLCGQYYGDDQLQFFHHLKQHYEADDTAIIMENHIDSMQAANAEIAMNKINSEDIVVESNQLPESLVELSLEGPAPDKASLYTHKLPNYISAEKSLFSSNDKDTLFSTDDKAVFHQKQMYTNLEKHYSCHHCPRLFRRLKQYEAHLKEINSNKMDDLNEFSEPEDLMEGIHVVVEPDNEEFLQDDLSSENSNTILIQGHLGTNDQYILPHLTIENGHVHQSHLMLNKQWYVKEGLGLMPEKSNDNTMIGECISGDDGGGGGDSVDGVPEVEVEENEVQGDMGNVGEDDEQDGQVMCPLCGEIQASRKHFLGHAQQCHMQLKEDVLQRMMEVQVVVDGEIINEEIIDDNDLAVGENQEYESNPEKVEEIKLPKKEGKPVHQCTECDREFKHRNSLLYHQLSHQGTRPYPCEVCKKSFFSASALKVHSRLHSGIKPYRCEECGRMFRQWGDLKYHSISIHSNMKQHQCEYCGKDFARKYSLIVHRRIHTGEKNYKCEYCDKKFRASSYLQNHRRIHTGEKPHSCDVCGKLFRMKGDMKRHLNTHEKEKSKVCDKEEERIVSEVEDDKTAISLPLKRGKLKAGDVPIVTPKIEMKIEKQELQLDVEKDEGSNGNVKDSNDGMMSSPSSDAVLQDDSRLGSNFPLDGNTQIYTWPVYMT